MPGDFSTDPHRTGDSNVIDFLTHWSFVVLFVGLFVAGVAGAVMNNRAERRRARRYVRRVR